MTATFKTSNNLKSNARSISIAVLNTVPPMGQFRSGAQFRHLASQSFRGNASLIRQSASAV